MQFKNTPVPWPQNQERILFFRWPYGSCDVEQTKTKNNIYMGITWDTSIQKNWKMFKWIMFRLHIHMNACNLIYWYWY